MTDVELAFQIHADEQRRAWAKLTPLERLRWLQQAKEFSRRFLGAAATAPAPQAKQ